MVKSYSFHESNPNLGWLNHVKSIFLMVKSQFWAFREGPGEFDPGFHFPAGFSLLVMLISSLASRGGTIMGISWGQCYC